MREYIIKLSEDEIKICMTQLQNNQILCGLYQKLKEAKEQSLNITNNENKNSYHKKIDEATVIELNNYAKLTFINSLDYNNFFQDVLYKYDFNKEIYKFLIDACSLNLNYQNISYMGKLLSDWNNEKLKTVDEIKNYLKLKNFNNSYQKLKDRGIDTLSDKYIKETKKYNELDYGI